MRELLMLYATDLLEEIIFVEPLLAKAFPHAAIQIAHSAQEALDYLTERLLRPDKQAYPMPHLTLLDSDMSDSLAVLQWVRNQSEISTMRVVLLGSPRDLNQGRNLGADDYIRKTCFNLHLTDRLRPWIKLRRPARRRRRLRRPAFNQQVMIPVREPSDSPATRASAAFPALRSLLLLAKLRAGRIPWITARHPSCAFSPPGEEQHRDGFDTRVW